MYTYQATVRRMNSDQQIVELQMDSCVAAGYTGRDQNSVVEHISELKKLGVATPYAIPAMYWISPARLTSHEKLFVVGRQTSPEVEFLIAGDCNGSLYVTVACDHTDRSLEAVSVGKSKQICDKILGDIFWPVEEVDAHWDDIQIRSQVRKDNEWIPYQAGFLKDMLHYKELLRLIKADEPAGKAPCLLSGTIPVIGGEMIYASACRITLSDPHLKREIVKQYEVVVLPDRS